MSATDLVRRITTTLEAAGIRYMITGSFASSLHSSPRSTQDLDLVVQITREQIRELVAHFPSAEFYIDERAAVEALEHAGMFNVIDLETGFKVDFIIRKPRPFSVAEFDRRRPAVLSGVPVVVASPEDVVISKLEWATMGQSRRQIEDAARVLKVQAGALDLDYIEKWVGELALEDAWAEARRIAGDG